MFLLAILFIDLRSCKLSVAILQFMFACFPFSVILARRKPHKTNLLIFHGCFALLFLLLLYV